MTNYIARLLDQILNRHEEPEEPPYGLPTITPIPVDELNEESHVITPPTTPNKRLVGGILAFVLLVGWTIVIATSSTKLTLVVGPLTIASLYVLLRLVRGGWKSTRFTLTDEELFAPKTPSRRVKDALGGKKGVEYQAENILWETREHPLSLWAWWVGLVAVQAVSIIAFASGAGLLAPTIWLAGMAAVGIRLWAWDFTRICITNKRLLVVSGILNVTFKEMPLSKLTDKTTNFSRGSTMLAATRIIRTEYVTLVVESAGQQQALTNVYFVPRGYELNRLVVGLVD